MGFVASALLLRPYRGIPVATTLPNLQALLEFWHGTDDDIGFMHDEIVIAACEQARPGNIGQLVRLFYPSVKTTVEGGKLTIDPQGGPELPEGAQKILERGYRLWFERKRGVCV